MYYNWNTINRFKHKTKYYCVLLRPQNKTGLLTHLHMNPGKCSNSLCDTFNAPINSHLFSCFLQDHWVRVQAVVRSASKTFSSSNVWKCRPNPGERWQRQPIWRCLKGLYWDIYGKFFIKIKLGQVSQVMITFWQKLDIHPYSSQVLCLNGR